MIGGHPRVPARRRRRGLLGLAFSAGAFAALPEAWGQGAPTEEAFPGWTLRCFEQVAASDAHCTAFSDSQGARLIVATAKDGSPARIVIHVPPGAAQGDPIGLYLDSELTLQLRVWSCTERYCEAAMDPDAVPTVLPRLMADTKGIIIYRMADNLHLVPVSLGDFDKVWRAAQP